MEIQLISVKIVALPYAERQWANTAEADETDHIGARARERLEKLETAT